MKKISQYCQSCRAANEPGEMSCLQCGTPLMLVVYPPGMRHDQFAPTSHFEDHLLERISLLEIRLLQLSDSLSLTLQVISDQSRIMHDEHELVREMYEAIKNLGAKEIRRITPALDGIFEKRKLDGTSLRIKEIMAGGGNNLPMLEVLAREAFEFIAESDEGRTFDALKRAELIAPENVPLLILYSEQLFYADKFDDAKRKLEKVFEFAPGGEYVRLLLGAIYADQLEIEKAGEMLDFDFEFDLTICAANLISGMTAAFQNDWKKAAAGFEKSLSKHEFAENHYLAACVFFQTRAYEKSLEHFQKAVEIDAKFTDALFLKSVVLGILERAEEAEIAAQTALENIENGAQCMELFGKQELLYSQSAFPFLHFEKKKRLLTGGAQRIRKFVRLLIFHTLNSSTEEYLPAKKRKITQKKEE